MIFAVWLTLILLMITAGVVLRIWRQQLEPVRLSRVALEPAGFLVAEFLGSCYEGAFGFPSGLFTVDRAAPNRIVAQEFAFRQSHFSTVLAGLYRTIFGIGAAFGCFGALAGFTLAFMLTPALLYAAGIEVLLRYLLRSRIEAQLQAEQAGTSVQFTLRGPSALLVGRRLTRAFAAADGAALPGPATPTTNLSIPAAAAARAPVDAPVDATSVVREAVRAEFDQVVPHLVAALKRDRAFDDLTRRLADTERRLDARRDRPLAVAVHRLLQRVRRLSMEPETRSALDAEIVATLGRAGFGEFGAVGDTFDPDLHDPIAGRTDGGKGTVAEVLASGLASYRDVVIRAQVRVRPAGEAASTQDTPTDAKESRP
jgi:hypothetical protein